MLLVTALNYCVVCGAAASTESDFCVGLSGSGSGSGGMSNAEAKIAGAAIGGLIGGAMLATAVIALVLRGRKRHDGSETSNVQLGAYPYK